MKALTSIGHDTRRRLEQNHTFAPSEDRSDVSALHLSKHARYCVVPAGSIVIQDFSVGYVGLAEPDNDVPLERCEFGDAAAATAILELLVRSWQTEELYCTWENLMWAFFPANMGT